MKENNESFIRFTNTDNIEGINQEMQRIFQLKDGETEEKNIEKIQFDNLKFGIYFSKCKKNGEKVLVVKNKKKVRCGNYFINGRKKEFYNDLYFLVFHQEEKDRNIIFENLIEKILGIIRIKDTILWFDFSNL